MSSYSNSSYSSPQGDDDVDTSEPDQVDESPDELQADVPEGSPADVEALGDSEMKHADDSGSVIGRRNPDLETENLSVPDASRNNDI